MHEYSSSGITFARAHKKQQCIWKDLNNLKNVLEADLETYQNVSLETKVIDALKDGFKKEKTLYDTLGLKPYAKKGLLWWKEPWVDLEVEWSKIDVKMCKADEHDDFLQLCSERNCNEGMCYEYDAVISLSEIQHKIDRLAIEASMVVKKRSFSPAVQVDGKFIFKTTLVRQFSGNAIISRERLTTVKHKVYFNH